jgi:hypothetical protein
MINGAVRKSRRLSGQMFRQPMKIKDFLHFSTFCLQGRSRTPGCVRGLHGVSVLTNALAHLSASFGDAHPADQNLFVVEVEGPTG